jgi:hypothetical protein
MYGSPPRRMRRGEPGRSTQWLDALKVRLAGPQLVWTVPVTACEKVIVPFAFLAVEKRPEIVIVVVVVCPWTVYDDVAFCEICPLGLTPVRKPPAPKQPKVPNVKLLKERPSDDTVNLTGARKPSTAG